MYMRWEPADTIPVPLTPFPLECVNSQPSDQSLEKTKPVWRMYGLY